MKLPKLLDANFEQSLNLLDDSLVDSYKEWWDENRKEKRYGIIAKTIGYLALLFLIWRLSALSEYYYRNPKAYTMEINFFPFWLCGVIMAVFLVLLFGQIYGMRQSWKHMKFYNCQVRWFWYCLVLLLAVDLYAATAFTPIVTIYGTVSGCAVIVGFLINIYRRKVREIISELYDLKVKQGHKNKWLDKVLNFKALAKAGAVIVAGYYIYKFVFVSSESVVTAPLVIGAAIVLNIIMILMIFYLLFPSVIQGYYRNKYAEEYREWEGKTQIEWYGEKYFNRYIKGTEKEERNDDRDKETF